MVKNISLTLDDKQFADFETAKKLDESTSWEDFFITMFQLSK